MGWWGYDSDANDDTYNALGVGIAARVAADADVDLAVLDRIAKEVDGEAEAFYEPRVAFVGVTRLALVHELSVPAEHLKRARAYAERMLQDEEHVESFTDPEQRRCSLRDEISVFDHALAHETPVVAPSESLQDKISRTS